MGRKVRVRMSAKLYQNGQLVLRTTKLVKSRLLADIQKRMWDCCYLRVTYDKPRGYYNDGTYRTVDEVRSALDDFTEKSIMNYGQEELWTTMNQSK